MMRDFLLIAGVYLLGAVPFGYVLARVKGVDLRRVGSGNIGATNVGRALGKKFGLVALVLDVLKGFLPVLAALLLHGGAYGDTDHPAVVAATGLAAIVGHNWPVYLRFKGGKGVATSCGVFLALFPVGLAVAVGVWVVVVWVTRYVSVGSMAGAVTVAVCAFALVEEPFGKGRALCAFAVVAAGLSVLRHRGNIGRLVRGTEHRIGGKGRGGEAG